MAWALLLVSFLFIDVAASLPMGSLPLALAREGESSAMVSLVMGSAMFAALFGSVPVGWLADRIGRLPTMRYAVVLIVASMALLALAHGAPANGVVMALRSIAFVALFTAEFAYAGEIVSEDRLVSSVATLGIIGNLALAFGPASAVWMWQHGIGREQYVWADVPIAIGLLLLFFLPSRHDVRSPRRSRTILMRSAWLPALAFCVGAQLQGGINGALAVLTFHHRGIANAALLFTAIATTVIVLRYPAGRAVDIYGPRLVAIPTAIFQALGCVIAALAWQPSAVVVAGMFLGVAWAAVIPIGVALFYEKSSRKTRGVAMGAFNFASALGSAGGALIATASAAFGPGYTLAMLIASLAPLAALPFVVTSPLPAREALRSAKQPAPA
jgi:MFS family permease